MTTTLESLSKNLNYISETDAEIVPFTFRKPEAVTAAEVIAQAGLKTDASVEEVAAEAFFARLTTIKDWFGPREKEAARRFAALKTELEKEMTDLTVFKIGKIQIDIYVVGIDKKGRLSGVKTKAVET